MVKRTIQNISMEGKKTMMRESFRFFLDNLIFDNRVYRNGQYSLFVEDLPYEDQKLLLSYLVCPEEFEYYVSDPTLEREAIKDHLDQMQSIIDDRMADIYLYTQIGRPSFIDRINGETIRR